MTEWAFVRTGDWSIHSDDHAAVTARVCEFIGADDPVQVVKPATGSFDAGKAMLGWINNRVRLMLDRQPVRMVIHPAKASSRRS